MYSPGSGREQSKASYLVCFLFGYVRLSNIFGKNVFSSGNSVKMKAPEAHNRKNDANFPLRFM